MKCVRISKTVMDRREGGSEGGRELKAMKFGPGSHAVSVLNFGKHWRAFASKVLQHLCWELVGCMSNCDRSFATDCPRCKPSQFVSEQLFDDGLSWLAHRKE